MAQRMKMNRQRKIRFSSMLAVLGGGLAILAGGLSKTVQADSPVSTGDSSSMALVILTIAGVFACILGFMIMFFVLASKDS